MEILKNKSVSVATNPTSNLKLANGIAPVKKMLEMSINVCIGTDGAASNNTLNLFKEIHLISLIHKGINEDAECITAYDAFKFATQNGAKAFGIQEELNIEEG